MDFRNLDNMKLIEKGKAKKLRRLHMEGLRFELSVCEHSITMEAKLNEVQVMSNVNLMYYSLLTRTIKCAM